MHGDMQRAAEMIAPPVRAVTEVKYKVVGLWDLGPKTPFWVFGNQVA